VEHLAVDGRLAGQEAPGQIGENFLDQERLGTEEEQEARGTVGGQGAEEG
jgi:hypothetical protein